MKIKGRHPQGRKKNGALPIRHGGTKDNFCYPCAGNNRELCRRSCHTFPPLLLLVFSPSEKSNWGIILKSHLSLAGSIQKSWPDTPFRINGRTHALQQTFSRLWRRRQWGWRHPLCKTGCVCVREEGAITHSIGKIDFPVVCWWIWNVTTPNRVTFLCKTSRTVVNLRTDRKITWFVYRMMGYSVFAC